MASLVGSLKKMLIFCTFPIASIDNKSYREGGLPQSWKHADVVPIPKREPVRDVNRHFRPISLSTIVSKVVEGYFVDNFIKPPVVTKVDPNRVFLLY